jgi:hypothetical protein
MQRPPPPLLLLLLLLSASVAPARPQPLSVIFNCVPSVASACDSTLSACLSSPLSLAHPPTACLCYASAAACQADCGGALAAGDALAYASAGCAGSCSFI